jgi:hypothetical protein
MRVKFMDGPKAGDIREIPNDRHRWSTIKSPRLQFVQGDGEYPPCQITEYTILRLRRHVFGNEHLYVVDTACLAYSGPLPEIPPDPVPAGPLPFVRDIIARPEPDFLKDFDAWWRRKLWDFEVTQDRETRCELEILEDELTYNRL